MEARNNKLQQCCYCGSWGASSLKCVRNHLHRVHTKSLQCPICAKRFGGVFELNRHMGLTNGIRSPDSCELKQNFDSVSEDLINHAKRMNACRSVEELRGMMFVEGEKVYDENDGTDNLDKVNHLNRSKGQPVRHGANNHPYKIVNNVLNQSKVNVTLGNNQQNFEHWEYVKEMKQLEDRSLAPAVLTYSYVHQQSCQEQPATKPFMELEREAIEWKDIWGI